MKIVAATNNPDKLREFREIFAPMGCEIVSLKDCGVAVDPEETGVTFAENARIKALAVCRATDMAAMADDSGLCVDALDGAPGVWSARFGGEITTQERNQLLLDKLRDVPPERRTARFVSALCLMLPDGREFTTEGIAAGEILLTPEGTNGFGYDPIFRGETGVSYGVMSAQEKNRISHRGRAAEKMAKILQKLS